MTNRRKQLLVATLVTMQVISALLARRDLAQRTDNEVRGSKRAWRVVVTLNPGNAAIYWLFGRR